MATWHRIMIAAAMVCVIALVSTGASWLTRAGNADPGSADKTAKEIDLVHKKLLDLAHEEDAQERDMQARVKKTQSELLELQESLQIEERKREFERHLEQERIKSASLRVISLEVRLLDLIEKGNTDKKDLEALRKRMEEQHRLMIDKHGEEEQRHNMKRRPLRNAVSERQNDLLHIEKVNNQTREVRAAKRQALLARLEQLEGQDVGREPADRFRELERKLDALRRDVGELRRTQERQGKDEQKKPE